MRFFAMESQTSIHSRDSTTLQSDQTEPCHQMDLFRVAPHTAHEIAVVARENITLHHWSSHGMKLSGN